MTDKLLAIHLKGVKHNWSFTFYADPKHLDEWRADGLVIVEVVNTIPDWLPSWVPVRLWCTLQDLFNFKRN